MFGRVWHAHYKRLKKTLKKVTETMSCDELGLQCFSWGCGDTTFQKVDGVVQGAVLRHNVAVSCLVNNKRGRTEGMTHGTTV